MTTTTSSRMRRVAGGFVLTAASALIAVGAPAVGHADPGPAAGPAMGCETIHWGLFGSDRRKVCDGPKQSDGTWQRTRTVFTPASNPPLRCHSNAVTGSYGQIIGNPDVTCTGGYPIAETTQAQDSYPVAPDTVLPDEPGWLPPYTYNVL
ncbi:CDGP domain-containing protein [Mycolicibacterium sediminis]|uniref:CDGP domain-containing protein n=1 Tax=Mycolicibacterium sediminis TaxID=1286180 RepID=A0A7I7QVG5_9MYCO|nr:hypothetical protein [Mycolicibacterium sediminis]BBY30359.1 hypothetical protein MSEDJ_44550 [Mycolicibacterium sediminis]